ncbi:MAG: type II toxin-antitoxin system HicA family toxin [Puniceicoccales bacterium]|nr:type II toxin-antitoxin system HicA family toxin [Puniceicoccales bacterium]
MLLAFGRVWCADGALAFAKMLRCTQNDSESSHMTQKRKVLERLADPAKDKGWTLAELTQALRLLGFALKRTVGSHHIFSRKDFPSSFTVPSHGGAIQPPYVRQIRERFLNEKKQGNP